MKTNRPYVTINKESKLKVLMEVLHKNMGNIKKFDGIAGIMLDGGMSRGYADYLSEIDVVIFLHDKEFQSYKEEKTPIALGITKMEGYLYDIKVLNYEEEWRKEYDSIALWDMSYAKILYDTNGELKSLFDRKLKAVRDVSAAEGLMFEAWWNYKLAGDIWLHREDILQGHYCLNNAVKPLLSALFIANSEYIPHDKWLIHMSRTLEWKPLPYDELLQGILHTGDMNLESLYKRQKSLECFWNAINDKLCGMLDFNNGLKLMHRGVFQNLERIIEKDSFTLSEWKEFSSISSLNYEPLFSFTEIKDGMVMIDRNKLNTLGEKDLYDWFYDVVKAVRQESVMDNREVIKE